MLSSTHPTTRIPAQSGPRPYPPAPRRPVRRTRRTLWLAASGLMSLGAVLLLAVFVLLVMYLSPTQSHLASGVAVAGVDIGGQTAASASATLRQANLTAQSVRLTDGDRQWTLTLAELGVDVDIAQTVAAAESAASGTRVTPAYTIDLNQTQNALVALSQQVNVAATTEQAGRAMDIPVMLNRLYTNLSGELSDGLFELSMIELPALEPEPSAQYTGATTTHVVEAGQELGLIAKLYDVSLDDIVTLNGLSNPDLLYVGQELIIPAAGVYQPTAADAPTAPTSTGRSIVVSTENQRIYAYENGQLVHSVLVSTGLPATPTVKGDFTILRKYVATDMSGPDYYLPNVPYTMYFYAGYGIHGTYWHNAFGRPMSHGCVNLPTPEAEWFFNWADVGTPVRVI